MELNIEECGLSKNESKIYLYLLKAGPTTTGAIIKETRIANSRVYESLNSLISRGLVLYTIQRNGKHFQAADPKKLLEIEEEKKNKIRQMLPQLLKLQSTEAAKTTSAVYEGFEGFKTAFRKIIEDCPQGKTIHILGFSQPEFATRSLRTFLSNMNLKSAKKRQRLQILLDSSLRETLGKDRAKERFTEVRYMPEGYMSPAAIDVFEGYVYMFLWEERPFVFMIKNERIAESFRQYFKFLWSLGKD